MDVITFINQGAPLGLALLFALVGVAAGLITNGHEISAEEDANKRATLGKKIFVNALPQNLCLSAFSFDIWLITTLFTADQTTLLFYNIAGKDQAIALLLVLHILLYIIVLGWGGLVRGATPSTSATVVRLEIVLGVTAIVFCIAFQWY